MMKDITLIAKSYQTDAVGNEIATEVSKNICAEIRSVTRSEFFSASHAGMRPELMAEIFYLDYEDEREAVIDGNRYKVYRAFTDYEKEVCELYLERVCHGG